MAAAVTARGIASPPPRASELGRWESFKSLCRGEWGPPAADERPLRRFAWVVAVGWHVLVAVILVWLMYQQYLAPAHPPRQGQEDVVQVEFVGQGTPEEVGGGDGRVPVPASENAASASAAAAQRPGSEAAQPLPTPPEAVATPPTAAAQPPAVVAAQEEPAQPSPQELSQPLVVSEPAPDTEAEFELPPTMPRLEMPQLVVRERDLSAPEVSMVELPSRQAPALTAVAPRAVPEVALEQRVPEMVVREIAAPLPVAPTTVVARPPLVVAEQPLTARPVQARIIPSPPADTVATAPAASAAATASPAQAAPSSPARTTAAASDAAAQTASVQNAGPKGQAAPGGWSSPRRADDWGDSNRETAGAQKGDPAGIYNSDGSVRLAKTPGSAAPGRPPGTVNDEIVNLDRGGTWLKRKPTDYEPTTFDRYWRPNESLLEEWVRKSITTVRIPIPGTNKHVVCQTVLLLVGGGCGITDPNLLDVAATARPAPDVPFKPALQENNGSLPDPVE